MNSMMFCKLLLLVLSFNVSMILCNVTIEEINSLLAPILNKLNNVEAKLDQGFKSLHNFNNDRISVIEKVSDIMKIDDCPKQFATKHAFYFRGYVGEFFTPHFNCSEQKENPDNDFILHPTHDVAIISRCPQASSALNISLYVTPFLGDNIVGFGFGSSAKAWTGSVADLNDPLSVDINANHWTGEAKISSGEIIAQSHQHDGMSGGAVSNGYGYVGMAHIVMNDVKLNYACIISAKVLVEFVASHLKKLKTLVDCPNLEILNLPSFPSIDHE